MSVTPEMVEKARIHEANELLRKLSREVFEDGIDIERLPHAVDLVMNYSESAVQDAVSDIAKGLEARAKAIELSAKPNPFADLEFHAAAASLREKYGVKP